MVAVYTTLQGLPANELNYLLARYADRISDNTPWVIHLPDDENNMRGWKKSDAYVETLRAVMEFKSRHADVPIRFMTMSSGGNVHEDVRDIFGSNLARFVGISRAGNLQREHFAPGDLVAAVSHKSPVMCASTPFYDHNTMMPNGDVVLCCMDYSLNYVIGNLMECSYEDLFTSSRMNQIRIRAMQPGHDKSFICKQCNNSLRLTQGKDTSWSLADDGHWADHAGATQQAANNPV